jgi:hypothetical protein
MVKLVNAQDLGSCGLKRPSEFDSRYSHQLVRSEQVAWNSKYRWASLGLLAASFES